MPTSASTSSPRPDSSGAGRLTRAARELVAFVSAFGAGEAGRELTPHALQSQLGALLDRFSRSTEAAALRPDELEEARFALVAWLDEVILRSDWRGRDEWAAEPLQLRLYKTNRAGNEFYDHLRRLRPEHTRAREIYLLVLSLGFEGQYHDQQAERRALIKLQYETLRAARAVIEVDRERYLTPSAYELEIDLPPSGSGRMWRVLIAIAVILVVSYGAGWIALQLLAADVPVPRGSS